MFNEDNCLENLKHIVSEYADDENIKNLSLDELRSSYTKIADNIYPISVSNRLKYKNMLWNIDNLKPEIRSRFQAQLFNTWHSVYIKSDNDPIQQKIVRKLKNKNRRLLWKAKKVLKSMQSNTHTPLRNNHPLKTKKKKACHQVKMCIFAVK